MQISAHLMADYIYQPQEWCNKKNQITFSGYHFLHAFIVFITAYLFSLDFNFWFGALIIGFSHLLVDLIKSYMIRNSNKNYYFMDQAIHLGIIVIISYLYSRLSEINFLLNIDFKTTAIIASYIFCAKPANILIKNIFNSFSLSYTPDNSTVNNDKDLPNAGQLIGIMERFLTLSLILAGQYEAVGLIIAAKSILRFNDTQKNEYVLVGTLLSFGIAVIVAILINQL
jgi:hypothetical protein